MNDTSLWLAEQQRREELSKQPPCELCKRSRVICQCERCTDCGELLDADESGNDQCFGCYVSERDD